MDLKVFGIIFTNGLIRPAASVAGDVQNGETFLSTVERLAEQCTDAKLEWKRCTTLLGKKGKRGKPAYEMAVFYAILKEKDTLKEEKVSVCTEFRQVFEALALHHIRGNSPIDTTIQLS